MNEERPNLASASEMYRNAGCVGNRIFIRSLKAEGLLSKQEESKEATLGTRIHAFLEGLPEELERTAQEVADECERLARLVRDQVLSPRGPDWCELYEDRFFYRIQDVPFFTGKPDRVFFPSVPHLSLVAVNVNFKTGRKGAIDAHLNLQVRTENVLIKHAFPQLQEIAGAIVQPLVTRQPEIVIYDEKALATAEEEILEIVDATEWSDKRTAGPWCEYCPGRAYCPEARQLALSYPMVVVPDKLPVGELGEELLARVEIGYKILDAIWEAYKELVESKPGVLPKWHIGAPQAVRFVKDIDGMVGLWPRTKELIKRTMSIGKLENLASDATGLRGKALDEYFTEKLGHLIGYTERAGSLERIPKKLLK